MLMSSTTHPVTCNGCLVQATGSTVTQDGTVIVATEVGFSQVVQSTTLPTGIYGCQKKCLYLLVLALTVVVVLNMAVTVWIIKVLDLSSAGPGKMALTKTGVRFTSGVESQYRLYAEEIHTSKDLPLKVESSRNVTLVAENLDGTNSNVFSIGDGSLESVASNFVVRSPLGGVLFRVDPSEVVVAADNVMVTNSGGFHVSGSLETTLVRAEATQDLRLNSPLKTVKVYGGGGVKVQSRASGIQTSALHDLKLRAASGRLVLDSSRLEIKHLETSWEQTRQPGYRTAYQLCSCDNGRLFLATTDGVCQAPEQVCLEEDGETAIASS